MNISQKSQNEDHNIFAPFRFKMAHQARAILAKLMACILVFPSNVVYVKYVVGKPFHHFFLDDITYCDSCWKYSRNKQLKMYGHPVRVVR